MSEASMQMEEATEGVPTTSHATAQTATTPLEFSQFDEAGEEESSVFNGEPNSQNVPALEPVANYIQDLNNFAKDVRDRVEDVYGLLSMKSAEEAISNVAAEEEEEEIVEIVNVTVKFRLSDVQVIAQVYPNRMLIGDVKKDIARKFEVNADLLCLSQCGRELSDECLILDCESDEFGIHEFDLKLMKPELERASTESVVMPKLDLNIYYSKYRLPDFITVHIPGQDTKDGQPKNIVVEIQNKAIVKPFLCGYKHKRTGIEYLDAFTQTGPYFDKCKYRRYYSRDTQTYEYKLKLIDTMHDQASQCFLDGNNVLYVSAATDFTILPRKYQTYAQKMRMENKLKKIILIQRNWRRFLIVRYMKNAAKEYRRLVANRIAEEQRYEEEAQAQIQRTDRVKQFPYSKDDFDLLYGEVQKWKISELKRIASMYGGASRIAEVNILLDKEIQLLTGIDRQRQLVFKAMQDFRDEKLLTNLGKPIKWIGYKDHVIHMDLIRTQRVRFLHELYKELKKPVSKSERLELLQKVKEVLIKEQDFPDFPELPLLRKILNDNIYDIANLLKEHHNYLIPLFWRCDNQLVQSQLQFEKTWANMLPHQKKLFDLFDREKNLLIYTKSCDVEILRKRQLVLFMDLIKFSKDGQPQTNLNRLCTVCKQVKPFESFAIRTRQNSVDTCQKCYYLKTASNENTTYAAILRAIQREERKKRCLASYAFVLQVDDVRYLIDRIWHGHSILSKNEKLTELRLPRWIKSEDWSPWNCICLTESEARNHYIIQDLEKVYDQKIILEIGNRHKLARAAFHKLVSVAVEFLETGQWSKVGLNKQRNVTLRPALQQKKVSAPPHEDKECKSN